MAEIDALMLKEVKRVARAVEKITAALEPPPIQKITWQEAVTVLRKKCMESLECGPKCQMYQWCKTAFSDEIDGPCFWPAVEEPGR